MLLFIVMTGLVLTGCDEDPIRCSCPATNGPSSDTAATLAQRIERNNEFAFDLYREVLADRENLMVSPHSIATTFGMAYAGARGQTAQEIAQTLHFNYPPQGFHSRLMELNTILESRGSTVGPESFRLNIANSAWGRSGGVYLPAYLDTLSTCYGADLQYLDFVNAPEISRLTINNWAFDQTYGLISGLIPPGSITPLTVLVLANTIYFRASWLHQFDPTFTYPGTFKKLDGTEVTVQYMSGEERYPFQNGAGYIAMGLPYKGEECTMILILPDEGNFESFEASLTPAVVNTIISQFSAPMVRVTLPKFAFETAYDLMATLENMGINKAFYPGADFSGIDGTDDGMPWISFVAHKTMIGIDEYGTMAAAGTAMGFSLGMPAEFQAVRPFIFIIRDDATGTILFLGRVLDPSV
jgi:serpin B